MFALSPIVTTALNTFLYFPLIFEYNTIFPRSWVTVFFFCVVNDQTLVNIVVVVFLLCFLLTVGVIVIENSFLLDVKKEKRREQWKKMLIIRRIIKADQNQIQGSGVCAILNQNVFCFAAGLCICHFVRSLSRFLFHQSQLSLLVHTINLISLYLLMILVDSTTFLIAITLANPSNRQYLCIHFICWCRFFPPHFISVTSHKRNSNALQFMDAFLIHNNIHILQSAKFLRVAFIFFLVFFFFFSHSTCISS